MSDRTAIDASTLREMVSAGAAFLEKNKEAVNALNVFPVPDGDTGTNMSMTMLSALREINSLDTQDAGAAAEALAKGALRGARGNSGVILSQLFRGFAKALENAEQISPRQFAAAIKSGADTAYKAVMKPKEGTILTVARVVADDAIRQAEQEPEDFDALFRVILTSGESILRRTQEMLPVLKQAGVIDAGGKGLMLIYAGYASVLRGEQAEEIQRELGEAAQGEAGFVDDHDSLGEIRFAYCTEFLIQNLREGVSDMDITAFRRKLSRIGDSVLVVGDLSLVKVHVHTNEPGKALQYGVSLGELDGMKIENMLQQRRDNQARREQASAQAAPFKDYGIVSVALGEGFSRIFTDLGVDCVVDGGQTMNPSIEDLQKAVESVRARTVFVLPNNGNVILAARQVAELTDRQVIVLPTKNVAMGIASVVAFQPDFSAAENEERMNEAAQRVRTGTITFAVRDTDLEDLHIHEGDVIGLNNGRLTVTGASAPEVAMKLMGEIVTPEDGLITVYYGVDVPKEEAETLADSIRGTYPDCDVEVHWGGQPLYYYLLSVE